MDKERVAIVGVGLTGLSLLTSYYKNGLKDNVEITCFDSEESFGRGFPFREDSMNVMLNLPASNASYDYEEPFDLISYLDEIDFDYDTYIPRPIYGDYLHTRTMETIKSLDAKIVYELVSSLDYCETDETFTVTTVENNSYEFDRVHLCTGITDQKDPYDFKEYDNFINNVYPLKDKLKIITNKDSAAVIGVGLTGIDVARYLIDELDLKKVYFFSNSNIFPTARGEDQDIEPIYFTEDRLYSKIDKFGFISFEDVEDLFIIELKEHGLDMDELLEKYGKGFYGLVKSLDLDDELSKLQSMFKYLNPLYNIAKYFMTTADKEKFNKKFGDFIKIFGGPTPLATAEILCEAYEKGTLIILDGVDDIRFNHASKMFEILDKNKRIIGKSNYVFNATGLDKTMQTQKDRRLLIYDLIDKEIASIYKDGGITVLPETKTVVSPKYGNMDKLHAHGVLISGVQANNSYITTLERSCDNLIKKTYLNTCIKEYCKL